MTTTITTIANTANAAIAVKTPPAPAPTPTPARFRFPDPPEREPDEMTSIKYLYMEGSGLHLKRHLGNRDTTLVTADFWVARGPRPGTLGLRRPDLLIAFDVDLAAYDATGGYLISEQGKPPDFVLEVASESTAHVDVAQKPADYAALGIPEYWRFDATGKFHHTRLAGDQLVDGHYEPIPIEELPDGSLQGYSAVLNLYLRAEQDGLGWYDPETGQHIPTFDDKHEAQLRAEARVEQAEAHVEQAEARAEQERAARLEAEARTDEAEARNRELEEELRQLRNG